MYLHYAKQGTDRFTGGSRVCEVEPEAKLNHHRKDKEMKFFQLANTFKNDESGAVTVDWVVPTAAIVGLGIAVLTSVSSGTTGLADKISAEMDAIDPGTVSAPAPSTL